MALSLFVNGVPRQLETLAEGSTLAAVVAELSLKADRVAIERNGEIAPRSQWAQTAVTSGDRLEIVHFVGGGCPGIVSGATSQPCAEHPQKAVHISPQTPSHLRTAPGRLHRLTGRKTSHASR